MSTEGEEQIEPTPLKKPQTTPDSVSLSSLCNSMQNCFSEQFSWFYPKIQKDWCCSDSHQELQFVLYANLHFWPLLKVQLQRKGCWYLTALILRFKWTLLVELAWRSCPCSPESLSEAVLDQPETPFSQAELMPLGSAHCAHPQSGLHVFTSVLSIGRIMGATPAQMQMPGEQQGNLGLVNLLPSHTQVHFTI